ncbi:MAG: hypothetical protein CMN27_05090 [Salinisphaera sp.]|nr:hypothetical protein [Salinisphaera sp.]
MTSIEVATKSFESFGVVTLDGLQKEFQLLLESNNLELSTKAEFMSKGSIWSYLGVKDKTGNWIVIGAFLYAALFGAEIQGIGTEGIITAEMREQMLKAFLTYIEANDVQEVKDSLQLQLPDFKTSALETSAYDAPDDIERHYMLTSEEAD